MKNKFFTIEKNENNSLEIYVKKSLSFKPSNLIRIGGKFLKIIGSIFHRTDIYFLGHYFEGSGKPMKLPEKFNDLILNTFKSSLGRILRNDPKLSYDGNSLFWDRDSIGINHFIFVPGSEGKNSSLMIQLYHSVGKFKIIPGQGYLFLEDEYIFYPWCGVYTHFSDCTCENKNWTGLYLEANFGEVIKFICDCLIKNKSILVNFKNIIRIKISNERAAITINDSFFSNLGNPFYVFSKIPYQTL